MNSKVKVQLEYSQKVVVIEIESYKPISIIKEKALNAFYPFTFDKKYLSYSNKDISAFESQPIGEFFKGKSSIMLKINNSKSTSTVSAKVEKKKVGDHYDPEDNYLRSRKVKVASESDPIEDGNTNSKKLISDSLLCACGNENIMYFCRRCLEYVCKSCRVKPSHINHKTIMIDSHCIEESVKLYCINIQADTGLCVNAIKGYSKLFLERLLMDFKAEKQILTKKLEEFEEKIELMIKSLPPIEANKSANSIINDVEQTSKNLNDEIEKILSSINSKKLDLTSGQEIITKVSTLEDQIEQASQKALAYRICYDVDTKIRSMYDGLAKSVDKALATEYKFNLDFSKEESKLFSSEVFSILKQTANIKDNQVSNSISNLTAINNRYKHLSQDEADSRKRKSQVEYDTTEIVEIGAKESSNKPQRSENAEKNNFV